MLKIFCHNELHTYPQHDGAIEHFKHIEELEKEADEYATENYEQCIYNDVIGWETDYEARKQAYIAGAEFGYNKANEWHNVKDGNPNNENDILCQISKDEVVVGYYHTVAKRYITIDGQDLYNVIAWKEIVLPEEIKEK